MDFKDRIEFEWNPNSDLILKYCILVRIKMAEQTHLTCPKPKLKAKGKLKLELKPERATQTKMQRKKQRIATELQRNRNATQTKKHALELRYRSHCGRPQLPEPSLTALATHAET